MRAVPPLLKETYLRPCSRFARPFNLSRLRSRIASAVHKCSWYSQLAETPAIQILIRTPTLGRKSQPDATIPLHHILPVRRAMIREEQVLKLFVDEFRMIGKSLKETS